VAEALGATAHIDYMRGYPATVNSVREAAFAASVGERIFGKGNVITDPTPTMGGEDFSYMLAERPGAYVWLGQGGGPGGCFLHHPEFDFNDDVIPLGAGYLAALVEQALPLGEDK
jgi:metal-dependent amidase/aminoacylase/carboxypeptidase family protein